MDIKNSLLEYGKKHITIADLTVLLKVNKSDSRGLHDAVTELTENGMLEPIKSSGVNGNIRYPLYNKYRILVQKDVCPEVVEQIGKLHPILLKRGYLLSHPEEYMSNKDVIEKLNLYLFLERQDEFVSRKERSFEIFGCEKLLDNKSVKDLLSNLRITENDLRFYDTPEYCFPDYIPQRKENLTLLICENKDIWFNIRRCMFEDNYKSIFGVALDGVVYGGGNKISQKRGALCEYVKFMGNPTVRFLYWGDIDREGFDIYRRTKNVNASLNISLFVPGYRKMIERAQKIETGIEDSSSSKKDGMNFDDLIGEFSLEERAFLKKVFETNKLIPQEIIPYILLSER